MELQAPAADRPGARAFALRDLWFVGVVAAVIALDQLTKWLIRVALDPGHSWPEGWSFRIVHFTNTGAAFGILQDSGPLLVITSLLGVVAILIYLLNPGFAHPLMRFGLALMLGGALGNLADRLRNGEVVDFLKVPQWPAFNVADSAITIGVLCLLWVVLMESNQPAEKSASS